MPNQKSLRPGGKWTPKSLKNLAFWYDASDPSSLYTTDAGPVTAVSSPLDISGCVGWWDCSRTDRMFNATSGGSLVANGGAVLRLDDLSGNNKHLIQSASGFAPTRLDAGKNGLPTLNFAGTKAAAAGAAGDWNFLHNTNGGTVIAVLKPFDTADPQTFAYGVATNIGGGTNGTGWSAFFDDRSSGYSRNNHVSHAVTAGVAGQTVVSQEQNNAIQSANDFSLLSFTPFAGSSTTAGRAAMHVSGTATGNTNSSTLAPSSSNSTNALTVGTAGANSIAGLAELIVYSTALSTADRARVEAYLATKWGISGVHAQAHRESLAVAAPTELSGCVGWYDSADLSAMKQNSDGTGSVTAGNFVGYWQDKSASGNHLTAPTPAKRPVLTASSFNGRTSLVFDGIDDTLLRNPYSSQSGLAGLTRIAVCAQTQSGVVSVMSRDTAGSGSFVQLNAGARFFADNSASFVTASPATYTTAVVPPTILSTVLSPSSFTVVDGGITQTQLVSGTVPSTTGSAAGQLSVGGNDNVNFWWKGPIAEYIIFNRALTSVELKRVENYLAAKWGIANVPLPSPPVGYIADKSGRGKHAIQSTAANRPTISATTQNGRRQLELSATVGNALIATATSLDAPFSLFAVVKKAARGINTFLGSTDSTRMNFGDGNTFSGSNYGASRVGGAVLGSAPIVTGKAQVFSAVSSSGQLPQAISMWADNVGGSASIATFAAPPSNAVGNDLTIGSQGSTSYGGTVCEVIAYSEALPTAARRRVEKYLAAKWGVTTAPQVSNSDAQDWINRVYRNGGTVSMATAGAVNEFCNTIDKTAFLRQFIYRLNLFCGNSDANLAAVRTPVYVTPHKTNRNLFQYGSDLTNAVWQAGGAGAFTRVIANTTADLVYDGFFPTKLTTATSAVGYQIYQNAPVYGVTVTLSCWLKTNSGTVDVSWLQASAVSAPFTVTTTWTLYTSTFTLPAYTGQGAAETRCGLYSQTPLNGSQYLFAWGMQLELGSVATEFTQPVYGYAMDAHPTPFAASDYVDSGTTGGLSPNGANKYLDTGLAPAHLQAALQHLSVYEVQKPSGSYRVRIGSRENSAGNNTHSITNTVDTTPVIYTNGPSNTGAASIAYSEFSGVLLGTSFGSITFNNLTSILYKNALTAFHVSSGALRTVFPTNPYYVFALNNGGVPGDFMNTGRLAAYSIGSNVQSIRADRLLAALNTFQTTLNRLNVGANGLFNDITNADALDWVQRVYVNGGTVSPATAAAVNTFCNAIDAAGIRDRIYRLNIFAGDSDGLLAAVRTPLYRNWKLWAGRNLNKYNDPARWTASGASVSISAIARPFPYGQFASVVTATATTAEHYAASTSDYIGQGRITVSAYLKANGHTTARLLLSASSAFAGGSTVAYANINLSNGSVSNISAGATATAASVGDGWYRLAVTATTTGTPNIAIRIDVGGGGSYSASGSESVLVWGVQSEIADSASEYDPYPLGNATDDNVNFVAADYSPTTGLTGNASAGKFLRTGVATSLFAGNNLHMGVGVLTSSPNTSTGSTLIGHTVFGAGFSIADRLLSQLPYFSFGASQGAGPTSGNLDVGNYVASYPNAYRDGFYYGNSATAYGSVGSSADFLIFGVNTQTSSRLGWYSIGTAFNTGTFFAPSTEVTAFTSAMAALQLALGRSRS